MATKKAVTSGFFSLFVFFCFLFFRFNLSLFSLAIQRSISAFLSLARFGCFALIFVCQFSFNQIVGRYLTKPQISHSTFCCHFTITCNSKSAFACFMLNLFVISVNSKGTTRFKQYGSFYIFLPFSLSMFILKVLPPFVFNSFE